MTIADHAEQNDAALVEVTKTTGQADDTVSVNNEQPVNNEQNDAALVEVTKTDGKADDTVSVNNAQHVKTTQVPAVSTGEAAHGKFKFP